MATRPKKQADNVKKSQIVNLLWEEWKYRHDVFWQSIYRWGLAVGLITIAPYVSPNLIGELDYIVLFFPILAGLVSMFASWHLGAEYVRLKKVDEQYRPLLGKYRPQPLTNRVERILFKTSIGRAVSLAFLALAVIIETASILALLLKLEFFNKLGCLF